MRLWFDTEFIEDGKTIDLISIGAIREDGRCFYAESAECDRSRASDWVKKNVFPHLSSGQSLMPRAEIAKALVEFAGDQPEFWAYYADYDWVVLCQLFGTMMQLPKGWPKYCRDVKQFCESVGNSHLPFEPALAHNAIADAIWAKDTWEFLYQKSDGG